jgi:hypothetical protein
MHDLTIAATRRRKPMPKRHGGMPRHTAQPSLPLPKRPQRPDRTNDEPARRRPTDSNLDRPRHRPRHRPRTDDHDDGSRGASPGGLAGSPISSSEWRVMPSKTGQTDETVKTANRTVSQAPALQRPSNDHPRTAPTIAALDQSDHPAVHPGARAIGRGGPEPQGPTRQTDGGAGPKSPARKRWGDTPTSSARTDASFFDPVFARVLGRVALEGDWAPRCQRGRYPRRYPQGPSRAALT